MFDNDVTKEGNKKNTLAAQPFSTSYSDNPAAYNWGGSKEETIEDIVTADAED